MQKKWDCTFKVLPALLCVESVSIYFLTISILCLVLKALHVQEERDRLRLEFNELEERVNPNFFSLVFFFYPWCVVCQVVLDFFQSACTKFSFSKLCLHVCLCTRLCTNVCAHVYTWSFWDTPATTAVCLGVSYATSSLITLSVSYFGVSHAFLQQQYSAYNPGRSRSLKELLNTYVQISMWWTWFLFFFFLNTRFLGVLILVCVSVPVFFFSV